MAIPKGINLTRDHTVSRVRRSGIGLLLGLASLTAGCYTQGSQGGNTPSSGANVVVADDPGFIMREPDQYAWQLLCRITNPSKSTGGDPAWYEWTSALRLFADPNGFAFSDEPAMMPSRLPLSQLIDARLKSPAAKNLSTQNLEAIMESPHMIEGKSDRGDTREDVTLNDATVKFILENDLISAEGQEAFVRKGGAIDFPKESIELKTVWLHIAKEERFRYLSRPDPFDPEQYWGLVSMHITTKDIPNWFWATFEHADNFKLEKAPFKSSDRWGFVGDKPSAGLGALLAAYNLDSSTWSNYRLTGSQVDYIDVTGVGLIRGNNRIEGGLPFDPGKKSSCMTCHVRSTVGNALSHSLNDFEPGPPKPEWFTIKDAKTGATKKLDLRDFVWSLARAKHRGNAPESVLKGISPSLALNFLADVLPLFKTADIKELKTRGVEVHKKGEVLKHFTEIRDYMKEEDPTKKKPRWSAYLITQFEDWNKAEVERARSAGNPPQSPKKS